MAWTLQVEDTCSEIALEAQILYICYNEAYRKYKYYSLYFIIPTIILSSVVGGLSFNEKFSSDDTNKVVLASINIFIAILNALFKILNIDTNQTENYYISKMFYLLYEKIRIELQKEPQQRSDANAFIREITEIKNALFERNVNIDKEIVRKYKQKYRSKIELPLLLKHLAPLKIFGRDERTQLSPSISSSLQISI